jgi:hypothetical protein
VAVSLLYEVYNGDDIFTLSDPSPIHNCTLYGGRNVDQATLVNTDVKGAGHALDAIRQHGSHFNGCGIHSRNFQSSSQRKKASNGG